MDPAERRRWLSDRVLTAALRLAQRIDPTITGVHAVRLYKPSWSAGVQCIEDACMPPDRYIMGDMTNFPRDGLHTIHTGAHKHPLVGRQSKG